MQYAKNNADIVDSLQSLVRIIKAIDPKAPGHGFDVASKSRLIQSLQQVARDIDQTDPTIATIREAAKEAEKCGKQHAVKEIEITLQNALNKESLELFPREFFSSKKDLALFVGFWLLLGSIPIALVAIGSSIPYGVPADATGVAGTIGDAFGLSNSFFSGLALLFVAATMYLQRKELALQRNELRLTRDEMRRSSESQDEQAKRLEASARIASLSHIYDHYNSFSMNTTESPIARGVAQGKKRWAIRHLHLLIEPDAGFRMKRIAEVRCEEDELVLDLREIKLDADDSLDEIRNRLSSLPRIAESVAALIAEENVDSTRRDLLYQLYDLIWRYESEFRDQFGKRTITVESKADTIVNASQTKWLLDFCKIVEQIVE